MCGLGGELPGLDAHKKPLMCGLGGKLPSQRFKGFKVFKGLEGCQVSVLFLRVWSVWRV